MLTHSRYLLELHLAVPKQMAPQTIMKDVEVSVVTRNLAIDISCTPYGVSGKKTSPAGIHKPRQ